MGKITFYNDVHKDNFKFLEIFLQNNGRKSKETLRQYENSLKQFLLWYATRGTKKHLKEISMIDLLMYQEFLRDDKKLIGSSINFKRNTLSSFYSFLIKFFPDEFSPKILLIFKEVPPATVKIDKRDGRGLANNEYKLICKYLEKNKDFELLLFVKLQYFYGLKLKELRDLPRDILYIPKNQRGLYPVYFPKRRCPVYFNQEIMDEINRYVENREDDFPYIFYKVHNGVFMRPHLTTFNYWVTNNLSALVGRKLTPQRLYRKNVKKKVN